MISKVVYILILTRLYFYDIFDTIKSFHIVDHKQSISRRYYVAVLLVKGKSVIKFKFIGEKYKISKG